ncbi:HAMP domain-containing histidine kinase [Candidatus Saccharibacteria bacterium]|nr:HAMP domain-containing histidine kinase [Candidatus Saccharibacteria bacterium]
MMFHSAALKLTMWYLAIIMALSIGLSVALYYVSNIELTKSANRTLDFYNIVFGPDDKGAFSNERLQQLSKDRAHLRNNLVLFNVGVLLVGGGASYALARRTLQPIEEALEAQKRFTGDASHELRTPLTAMQTEIEVALRSPSLSKKEATDLLKSNLEEVGKLRNLSEGLLILATASNNDLPKQKVLIKDAVEQAAQAVAKLAKSRKISIKTSARPIQVVGNHQQILNLLSILLDNAIKYSQPGGEVELTAKISDQQAIISVIDHGQGIEASDLPYIFERFYRADASRSKNHIEGYGLGLAIAKKIVDLHNGSIEVASTPNMGSTFIVKLPLTKHQPIDI